MQLTMQKKETAFLTVFGLLLCYSSWRMLSDYLNPLYYQEPPESFGPTFNSVMEIIIVIVCIYIVFKIRTKIGKVFWGILSLFSVVELASKLVVSDGEVLLLLEIIDRTGGAIVFIAFGLILFFTKKQMHIFRENE